MIYTETLTINGRQLLRTYSDTYTIERDGIEYDEAVDPADSGRTYTETANLKDPRSETEQKAQAYDILTGVME